MKAVLCPVCKGSGKIATGLSTSAGELLNKCHGCGGRGWVEITDYDWEKEETPGDMYPMFDNK